MSNKGDWVELWWNIGLLRLSGIFVLLSILRIMLPVSAERENLAYGS